MKILTVRFAKNIPFKDGEIGGFTTLSGPKYEVREEPRGLHVTTFSQHHLQANEAGEPQHEFRADSRKVFVPWGNVAAVVYEDDEQPKPLAKTGAK